VQGNFPRNVGGSAAGRFFGGFFPRTQRSSLVSFLRSGWHPPRVYFPRSSIKVSLPCTTQPSTLGNQQEKRPTFRNRNGEYIHSSKMTGILKTVHGPSGAIETWRDGSLWVPPHWPQRERALSDLSLKLDSNCRPIFIISSSHAFPAGSNPTLMSRPDSSRFLLFCNHENYFPGPSCPNLPVTASNHPHY